MAIRRLIVMRHAKSSWGTDAATDHERPLNDRGRHDAPCVADHLVVLGWQPQFILSSDARRTRETAERMNSAWAVQTPAEFLRSLYHAGYDELVQASSVVPDDVETLVALGHNPGWEDVVTALTGERVTMKTATAALLFGNGECWEEALRDRRNWNSIDVIYPRDL